MQANSHLTHLREVIYMRYATIDMRTVGGEAILSGATAGKAAFLAVFEKAQIEPDDPSPLLLDFSAIEVATASYLREAVFALKSYLRTTGSKFYPVVANVNNTVREELGVIAEAKGDVLIAVETSKSGAVKRQTIIGSLDPKQATTFERVNALKRTDAGSLMEKFGSEENTTSTTAWNNRLAALVARGLILEYSRGRAKFYQPLFEEVR
jgi:hypothetical protein